MKQIYKVGFNDESGGFRCLYHSFSFKRAMVRLDRLKLELKNDYDIEEEADWTALKGYIEKLLFIKEESYQGTIFDNCDLMHKLIQNY